MTYGTHAIRAVLLALALAGCGSAAAQIPAAGGASEQRSSDTYLTAGDGRAEGPDSAFARSAVDGGTVGGDITQGPTLVP